MGGKCISPHYSLTYIDIDALIVRDKVIEYMYEFDDGWSHKMTDAGRGPATDNITCVDGTGHGVGEDVNREGWRELKAANRAVNPSSEQRGKMELYEKQCNNGDRHGFVGVSVIWTGIAMHQRADEMVGSLVLPLSTRMPDSRHSRQAKGEEDATIATCRTLPLRDRT